MVIFPPANTRYQEGLRTHCRRHHTVASCPRPSSSPVLAAILVFAGRVWKENFNFLDGAGITVHVFGFVADFVSTSFYYTLTAALEMPPLSPYCVTWNNEMIHSQQVGFNIQKKIVEMGFLQKFNIRKSVWIVLHNIH